jgi:hypothetical protein
MDIEAIEGKTRVVTKTAIIEIAVVADRLSRNDEIEYVTVVDVEPIKYPGRICSTSLPLGGMRVAVRDPHERDPMCAPEVVGADREGEGGTEL